MSLDGLGIVCSLPSILHSNSEPNTGYAELTTIESEEE